MKQLKLLGLKLTAAVGTVLIAASAYAGDPSALTSIKDKESYGTGIMIIRALMQQGGELNLDLVVQGMKDGLTGANLQMSEAEYKKVMAGLQEEMTRRQREAANKRSSTNAATANAETNSDPAIQKNQNASETQPDQGGMLAKKDSAGAAASGTGVSSAKATAGNSDSSAAKAAPRSNSSDAGTGTGLAQNTASSTNNGPLTSTLSWSGRTVAERGLIRSAIKKRAEEMRRQSIAEGR